MSALVIPTPTGVRRHMPAIEVAEPSGVRQRYGPPRDVARYTGLSTEALAQHRRRGTGPKFIKRGRSIFYDFADVDEWLIGTPTA